MNKQTIELYEQSVEFTKNYHNDNPKATQNELNHVCASKFSELIVKECVEIIMDDRAIGWADSIHIKQAIEENFGVE